MAKKSEEESHKASELEEEGEDEALSLCDLPLHFINNEETSIQSSNKEATPLLLKENEEEEFNFDSWGGSLSDMCAADEVFFKGQILPLRHSVSSDSGLLLLASSFQDDDNSRNNIVISNNRRCVSRSESLDRGSSSSSAGGFTITSIDSSRSSSGSSSTRSHVYYSSNRNSCITDTTTTTTTNSKPKIRNQFHSFPSPRPQIRVSNAKLLGNGSSRSQKSTTVWDFFRVGLVRAPEIELRARNKNTNSSVSRNSSSGSSSNTNNNSSSSSSSGGGVAAKNQQQDLKVGKEEEKEKKKKKKKKKSFLVDMRKGLFRGCKCSVETVPLNNIVIIKSNGGDHKRSSSDVSSNVAVQDMEKKLLQELKIKRKVVREKQAMSRHRTFEWLKELSHAGYVVDGNLNGTPIV